MYPLEVYVSFQAPRAGARIVRIQFQLGYRSYNEPLEKWSRSGITRNRTWAKTALQQHCNVADPQQQDQLQRNIDYYGQLDALARNEANLYLHYRLSMITEGYQVVLANSEPSETVPYESH